MGNLRFVSYFRNWWVFETRELTGYSTLVEAELPVMRLVKGSLSTNTEQGALLGLVYPGIFARYLLQILPCRVFSKRELQPVSSLFVSLREQIWTENLGLCP